MKFAQRQKYIFAQKGVKIIAAYYLDEEDKYLFCYSYEKGH